MRFFNAGTLSGVNGAPPEQVTFRETVHGPVSGTVTVKGKPYAIATLRSSRGREALGAFIGSALNEGALKSARDLARYAGQFDFTFNLFYVDHRDIAFFSAGRLPVRAPGTNPSLPTLGTGKYDWRGFLTQRPASAGDQPSERPDPQLEQQARRRLRRRRLELDAISRCTATTSSRASNARTACMTYSALSTGPRRKTCGRSRSGR